MDNDKERKEEPKKRVHPPPPPLPPGGLRRSQRLRSRPSSPPYYGGSRKQARRQQQEETTLKDEGIEKVTVDDPPGTFTKSANLVHGGQKELLPPKEGASTGGSELGGGASWHGTNVKGGAAPLSSSSRENADNDQESEKGSPEDPTEEEGEDEPHPCVFNVDVLDLVFKLLVAQPGSSKDAQNCRLVCKTWKDSVTRMYRQGGCATATFYKEIRPEQWEGKSLSDFVYTMRSSPLIPVQKFVFCCFVFRYTVPNIFRDFLRLCGPEFASLSISIRSGEAENILLAVEKLSLSGLTLPNLKSLQFHTYDDNYVQSEMRKPGQNQEIVRLLELLLDAAKTLRELELSYSPSPLPTHYNLRYQVLVREQLGKVIARRIPMTLKSLEMRIELSESNFNALGNAGLKLERFQAFIHSSMGNRTLFKFLRSQADSLTRLQLQGSGINARRIGPPPQQSVLVEFPRMAAVTSLELGCVAVGVVSGSDFAATFPKLHALNLRGMDNEDCLPALLASAKRPAPTLKMLHLPMPRWEGDSTPLAPFVKNVAESFPFLTELHIWLYSGARETLEEVFKYLGNLESLNITFAEGVEGRGHVDSIFLGISRMECDRIGRSWNFQDVNLKDIQQNPSILNLTKLKKLVVKRFFSHGLIIFTDVSAHFIFLEMANLREIDLTNTRMEFNPIYAELLKDKLIVDREGIQDLEIKMRLRSRLGSNI